MSNSYEDDLFKELVVSPLPVIDSFFHAEILNKVRAVYPTAMIFNDTAIYTNQALNGKPYAIAVNERVNLSECHVFSGNYEDNRSLWSVKSKWLPTIEECIEDTWIRIEHEMLKKLEK